MSEWTYVNTPQDLPWEDWNGYNWEYECFDIEKKCDVWESHAAPSITFEDNNGPTERWRYKKKPLPSDEYIERHLWNVTGGDKYLPVLEVSNKIHHDIFRFKDGISIHRRGFREMKHIPKDAMKDDIDEQKK